MVFSDSDIFSDKDILKLHDYISRCVSKLHDVLKFVYNSHVSKIDIETENEFRLLISQNFSEIFYLLDSGYDLVVDSNLFLKWTFLERFWFYIYSLDFLSSFEKDLFRDPIEYVQFKLNKSLKKSFGKFSL